MSWRGAARGSVVTTTAALGTLLGAPAAWALRDDGDDPGTPMSTLGWIFLFIVVPVALYVIITLLTYLPSMARKPRYRPESATSAAPVWFAGPTSRAGAAAGLLGSTAAPAAGTGGTAGAAPGAVGAVALDAAVDGAGTSGSLAGGGASARW